MRTVLIKRPSLQGLRYAPDSELPVLSDNDPGSVRRHARTFRAREEQLVGRDRVKARSCGIAETD